MLVPASPVCSRFAVDRGGGGVKGDERRQDIFCMRSPVLVWILGEKAGGSFSCEIFRNSPEQTYIINSMRPEEERLPRESE